MTAFPLPSAGLGDIALALAGGVALAAACGLRAFLPLLALSLAARAGLVHLADATAWLASGGALAMLAVATVLEIAGDKLPLVDHLLDLAAVAVRPAAAVVATWATFGAVDPRLAAVASLVLGAGALGVHVLKAKARLGGTLLTLGHLNPLLSLAEDLTSAAFTAMALLAPIMAAIVAVTLALVLTNRRSRRS